MTTAEISTLQTTWQHFQKNARFFLLFEGGIQNAVQDTVREIFPEAILDLLPEILESGDIYITGDDDSIIKEGLVDSAIVPDTISPQKAAQFVRSVQLKTFASILDNFHEMIRNIARKNSIPYCSQNAFLHIKHMVNFPELVSAVALPEHLVHLFGDLTSLLGLQLNLYSMDLMIRTAYE